MFDSNNYHESCSFSEQIVSYIYDEMSAPEKAGFAVHILDCASCAEEISGFSRVRTGMLEWKREEFLQLAKPEIQIPYASALSETKKPLLASIYELFSFSQVWVKTATAFASLAIISGIAFFVFSSGPIETEIVKMVNPVSSPTPQSPVAPVPAKEMNAPPVIGPNTTTPPKPEKPIVRVAEKVPAPKVIKATVRNGNGVRKVNRQENVTLISNVEDEDDSVRLSDLFDEIGTK